MKPDTLSHFAQYPSLQGRSVFVTGGSSGIGGDIVIAFARQGAKVAFTGRNAEAAQQVIEAARQLGPEPLFLQSDASDVKALRKRFLGLHTIHLNGTRAHPAIVS